LLLLVPPDAVVRLVEAAGEIGARIGQREAVAAAQVIFGQPHHLHAVAGLVLDGYQPHVIELARRPKQHAGLVERLAIRCVHRPRGIAERQVDVRRVRRFVLTPRAHLAREGDLAAREPRARMEVVERQSESKRQHESLSRRAKALLPTRSPGGSARSTLSWRRKRWRAALGRARRRYELGPKRPACAQQTLHFTCRRALDAAPCLE